MRKATFIERNVRKQFSQTIVEMEYEYRGMRYTVTENLSRGNEPLSWQHRNQQAWIDRILDAPKGNTTEDAQKGFDLFWDFVEGKEVNWDTYKEER